jgi:hypothetical protein
MKNEFELTKQQVKALKDNDWEPLPYGAWLRIEPKDFKGDWKELASNFSLDDDTLEAYLFVVGVEQVKQEDLEKGEEDE